MSSGKKRDLLRGLNVNPWEIEKKVRGLFNYKDCLAPGSFKPNCSKSIVRAHTVPRSGSLRKIAKEGHVYSGDFSFSTLLENGGFPDVKLVGINDASTFSGFCTTHDSAIFNDLENLPFVGSKKQCFLIAFRALSRELYLKKSLVKTLDLFISLANSGKISSNLKQILEDQREGSLLAIRDMSIYKDEFDKKLENEDYGDIQALIYYFEKIPTVLATVSLFLEEDFQGNIIQDFSQFDENWKLISFGSFVFEEKGVAVFVWQEKDWKIGDALVKSVNKISPPKVTDAFINFIFDKSENYFVNPDWWDSLSEETKGFLKIKQLVGTMPLTEIFAGPLGEITFESWFLKKTKRVH